MQHSFALLLSIVLVHARDGSEPDKDPKLYENDPNHRVTFKGDQGDKGLTTNVFAQGVSGNNVNPEDTRVESDGSVAHALGRHGVQRHLEALQAKVNDEWRHNLVLDYSLLNYKRSVAEMTRKCIKMMETLRDEMAFDTTALVNKEVDRVWPTLEVLNTMKSFSDKDRDNGYRGAWYLEPMKGGEAGQKVEKEQSFMLSTFYPQKEFYKNYLDNVLHRADHVVVNRLAGVSEAEGSSTAKMTDGTSRPLHGGYSNGDAEYNKNYHGKSTRHSLGSETMLVHGEQNHFHDKEKLQRSIPDTGNAKRMKMP